MPRLRDFLIGLAIFTVLVGKYFMGARRKVYVEHIIVELQAQVSGAPPPFRGAPLLLGVYPHLFEVHFHLLEVYPHLQGCTPAFRGAPPPLGVYPPLLEVHPHLLEVHPHF